MRRVLHDSLHDMDARLTAEEASELETLKGRDESAGVLSRIQALTALATERRIEAMVDERLGRQGDVLV